jgi:hypothetical protein
MEWVRSFSDPMVGWSFYCNRSSALPAFSEEFVVRPQICPHDLRPTEVLRRLAAAVTGVVVKDAEQGVECSNWRQAVLIERGFVAGFDFFCAG